MALANRAAMISRSVKTAWINKNRNNFFQNTTNITLKHALIAAIISCIIKCREICKVQREQKL